METGLIVEKKKLQIVGKPSIAPFFCFSLHWEPQRSLDGSSTFFFRSLTLTTLAKPKLLLNNFYIKLVTSVKFHLLDIQLSFFFFHPL